MKIYHNPRCRKSCETLEIIKDSGSEVEIVEYLKDTPTVTELSETVKKLGIDPLDLIRKNEAIFKENFKGKSYSDVEWLQIMVDNPILIERPVVVKGDKAVIGRPPGRVLELLQLLFCLRSQDSASIIEQTHKHLQESLASYHLKQQVRWFNE